MSQHRIYTREEDDGSQRLVCECGWNGGAFFVRQPVQEAAEHVALAEAAEHDQQGDQS